MIKILNFKLLELKIKVVVPFYKNQNKMIIVELIL